MRGGILPPGVVSVSAFSVAVAYLSSKVHSLASGLCIAVLASKDGTIPERYPLQELAGVGYIERTRKNVQDTDATLIIMFGPAAGGTARTIEFCEHYREPHLVIDVAVTPVAEAARQVVEFVKGRGVRRLNVAGPRASGEPNGYDYAYKTIQLLTSTTGG